MCGRGIVRGVQGFIWGQIFGGEPTRLYVRMYTRTHGAAQACVLNDNTTHTHACSTHIRFSFRIMIKMGQWQSSDVMRCRFVCEMIVV